MSLSHRWAGSVTSDTTGSVFGSPTRYVAVVTALTGTPSSSATARSTVVCSSTTGAVYACPSTVGSAPSSV